MEDALLTYLDVEGFKIYVLSVERLICSLVVRVVDAPESFSGALLPLSFDDAFEKAVGIALPTLVRGSNAPDGSWVNAGAERSGAGWKNPAAFIISSAMVRVLGATEQFELDVLKCLLYYRPSGLLGDSRDWVIQKVDPEVVYETPKKLNDEQLEYVSPPLWTWMKKIAVNNTEREKILKNVFGIVTVKPEDRNKKMGWYKQRNAIVHGRGGVEMTLREYFEVEAFAAKTMLHISEQCFELLKIAL